MPVYEFQCMDCGAEFPLTLSLKDLDGKNYKCPKCESKNLEKQITKINPTSAVRHDFHLI